MFLTQFKINICLPLRAFQIPMLTAKNLNSTINMPSAIYFEYKDNEKEIFKTFKLKKGFFFLLSSSLFTPFFYTNSAFTEIKTGPLISIFFFLPVI